MSDLRSGLQRIYDDRGKLTPVDVLDAATPEDHPLHAHFEWDDSIAGHKYRLVQAQDLIQSVRIVYRKPTGEESSIRAWTSVRRETGHRYEPTEQIPNDDIATKIVLADMRREWEAFKRRYQHYDEFFKMIKGDLEAA